MRGFEQNKLTLEGQVNSSNVWHNDSGQTMAELLKVKSGQGQISLLPSNNHRSLWKMSQSSVYLPSQANVSATLQLLLF